MDRRQSALDTFRQGVSCAPAVLSVFANELGLDRTTALKLACPFGGGMARMGNTCGAVTGAFMVIGLKHGMIQPADQQAKEKTYQLVREFVTRFESKHGSIVCRNLLGCDLNKPEQAKAAHDEGLFRSVCDPLVADAVEILEDLLSVSQPCEMKNVQNRQPNQPDDTKRATDLSAKSRASFIVPTHLDANCIFCRILAGELPSSIVHRDEHCTAFMDVKPVNPGHVLVVPNVHAALLGDLEKETAGHLFVVAQRIGQALRDCGIQCEGVNMFLADGQAAMQEVPHVHLHVFPRFTGDGFGLTFGPNYSRKPDRTELNASAERIRLAL